MKRYVFTVICILISMALEAQSGQSNGAPADVAAVDLGLPSGTRWASCNVGATKPEETGGYYAWGETEEKNVYNWENYIHCDGSRETCHSLNGNICGTQYDVAHVKWGGNWRMPTLNEIEELIDNCTYTVTELNSVQVMKFSGRNGNYIYLPFTGFIDGTEHKNIGYNSGYYWSGVNPYTNSQAPCMVPSASGKASYNYVWDKYLGLTVRPVMNGTPSTSVPRTFIDLGLPSGTKWANMNVGASRPEEYGKYFAWGETSEKDSYTWDNYMCPELTCGNPGDPVFDLVGDKADIAGTKFDAATINWGASWNMPTAKQIEELASNCYSSSVTINGVLCRKLISRINGNEIIFPLAGARWLESFAYEGTLGYYWSSTLRQGGYVSPCRLIVREDSHGWGWSMGGENDRFCAFPIRPVYVENNMSEDTITYHKFSVAFNENNLPEILGHGVRFQRNGNSDSYSLSIDDEQGSELTFDISKISCITRKSIGQFSLPDASVLGVNDITITADGDTITMDANGNYEAVGSTIIATNTKGDVVYMNIAAVEDANNAVGADLNAKESAITLMLPLVPNIFVAFDDEYLPYLKEMIWDVDEVKQLAEAIDRSVAKYGYTDFGEISMEATAARNKISQLLHLDKLAERQAESYRKLMLQASGSTESPYIVNPYGYIGLQVVITDSKQKKFYYPYNVTGYNCEVTAYNYNRFAYSSMVKGKYDAETDTYYIPDLGSDYDYYKNILKPQKVSTFMNTFTSFKYEDLERLGQLLIETFDPNISVSEMHWSDMKKTAHFDISAQDDAIVLLFPRGNDYMMVYNIMQSIMKPIFKVISKKAAKEFDSDIFIPLVCGKMLNDPNYVLEVKSTMFDSNLNSVERIDKITSVTWKQFFKVINNLAWDELDDGLKEALTDLFDELDEKLGTVVIDDMTEWDIVKSHFKVLSWIKKYGDIVTGLLGTFGENNAVYPIHWDANGQFVIEQDEVTVGKGESIKVKILVGNNSYSWESSDGEVATATGAYNRIEIHGVNVGDAVITVKDEIAQKTAKIKVHVTGIQNFALSASTLSVPMYEEGSVTIERGNGPFHIFGGNEKIAVAKLIPRLFPGEKNKIVISGVSEGNTIFYVYDEATHQTLSLVVNVTVEQVEISDERIVDLGLSVKWANCNVGASEPQEYGDYFAWGEVDPKASYGLNNYKYYSNGNFVDIGSDISGTQYDAATHNMGNDWRMPTKVEYEELISKCEWKFVTYRRVRGWKVTGPSGNSIFIPAAGSLLNDWNDYESINGFYWSSNITDNHREVYTLFTSMDDYKMSYSYMNCYEGRSIRAVTGDGSDETNVIEGSCGENVTYTFNETTGTLTISGTGAMNDYSIWDRPWYPYLDNITKVVVKNGVTSIGSQAFSFCYGLTSVTIGNNVTSIGNSAFNHCTGLTSVTIPNSVTSIIAGAFSECSSLTSVIIPNSVTSIGNYAFDRCSGLTSVTIGNSVTSIGMAAFRLCGLTSVTIPNSVTSIGSQAFADCSSLTSVFLGKRVTSIGSDAFYGCSLTSVTIPHSVTFIDGNAFSNCSSLSSINVESSNNVYNSRENCNAIIKTSTNELIAGCKNTVIPNSVTSIGSHAFYGCTGLTSVVIPNSVTSIGERVFYECSGLTSLIIPNSVIFIDDYAFERCSGLTSVTIGNGVTSISMGAFHECSDLTSITIPNSVTSIANFAFEDCSGLISVTIPNSVTSIGNYAFKSCGNLNSMAIPNSVKSIGVGAFERCSGLTSVTIGNSVTSIGDYAFSLCEGLTNLYCLVTDLSKLTIDNTVESSPFSNTPIFNATLHVPQGCKNMYAAEEPWKNFKEIVEINE